MLPSLCFSRRVTSSTCTSGATRVPQRAACMPPLKRATRSPSAVAAAPQHQVRDSRLRHRCVPHLMSCIFALHVSAPSCGGGGGGGSGSGSGCGSGSGVHNPLYLNWNGQRPLVNTAQALLRHMLHAMPIWTACILRWGGAWFKGLLIVQLLSAPPSLCHAKTAWAQLA